MRRGEILLDLSILDGWDSELERMNAGKEGEQYVYPDVFIRRLDAAQMEGETWIPQDPHSRRREEEEDLGVGGDR